jgi:hypothetical protein
MRITSPKITRRALAEPTPSPTDINLPVLVPLRDAVSALGARSGALFTEREIGDAVKEVVDVLGLVSYLLVVLIQQFQQLIITTGQPGS